MKTFVFDVNGTQEDPLDGSFTDRVTVIVDSGFPWDEDEEFIRHLKCCLYDWYEGDTAVHHVPDPDLPVVTGITFSLHPVHGLYSIWFDCDDIEKQVMLFIDCDFLDKTFPVMKGTDQPLYFKIPNHTFLSSLPFVDPESPKKLFHLIIDTWKKILNESNPGVTIINELTAEGTSA